MLRAVALCLLPSAVIALAGCGKAATYTLKGTIEMPAADCSASIWDAPVTVKNESGKVIAVSSTGGNTNPGPTDVPTGDTSAQDKAAYNAALAAWNPVCAAAFTVTVPRAQFYQLQIGTHGAPAYSFSELQQDNWHIALSLP
jgi:hypothetical protein